jgi:glycerophosphoryl diester phosphodiesterase
MEEEVTFSSFALERLAVVRALGDKLRISAILPQPSEFDLARAVALRAITVDVCYTDVSLRVVESAQRVGLEVLAWNPDTWREQEAMIALGVSGVSSNRPDILLAGLGRKIAEVAVAKGESSLPSST